MRRVPERLPPQGHRADLLDVLFTMALAISPGENLIKRSLGIFDVALLLTDGNDLESPGGLHVGNVARVLESLKKTDQIPARKLLRLRKKWFLPEYEIISSVEFAKKLLLDKTDQKDLDVWPLYPPVQLPDGYGSEAPKGFLPGMFDSIKGKLIGEPDIVPRPANTMDLPRIETDRQLSFEEFSCMLRTRQLCLWEMCRKTARVGTGNKGSKDSAPSKNLEDDADVDLVSIKRTEQLMDKCESRLNFFRSQV